MVLEGLLIQMALSCKEYSKMGCLMEKENNKIFMVYWYKEYLIMVFYNHNDIN
jgi:hypothetical protein